MIIFLLTLTLVLSALLAFVLSASFGADPNMASLGLAVFFGLIAFATSGAIGRLL